MIGLLNLLFAYVVLLVWFMAARRFPAVPCGPVWFRCTLAAVLFGYAVSVIGSLMGTGGASASISIALIVWTVSAASVLATAMLLTLGSDVCIRIEVISRRKERKTASERD